MPLEHNKKERIVNDEQILTAFVYLIGEALAPETPEEVDAELRAAGLDPEQIGRETVALVKRLSREAHERLEKCHNTEKNQS